MLRSRGGRHPGTCKANEAAAVAATLTYVIRHFSPLGCADGAVLHAVVGRRHAGARTSVCWPERCAQGVLHIGYSTMPAAGRAGLPPWLALALLVALLSPLILSRAARAVDGTGVHDAAAPGPDAGATQDQLRLVALGHTSDQPRDERVTWSGGGPGVSDTQVDDLVRPALMRRPCWRAA